MCPVPLDPALTVGPVVAEFPRSGDACELFTYEAHGREGKGMLLRLSDGVRAYVNRCPHWGSPLDSAGSDILRGDRVRCSLHGAEFVSADGRCVAGPCEGSRLTPLFVDVVESRAYVHAPSLVALPAGSLRPVAASGRVKREEGV